MNNLLPLLLFALSASKGGGHGENDLMKNLLNTFATSFGKENGELLSNLLSGKFDFDKMLPLVVKALASGGGNSPLSGLFSNANILENSGYPTFSSQDGGGGNSDFSTFNESENEGEEVFNKEATDANSQPNYLKPIADIADERINFALAHYLSNN